MTSEDTKLVRAMAFEYESLDQAYRLFLYSILRSKEESTDEVMVHLYRSYSQVIQHLYEFMKACVARDISKNKSEDNEEVKKYIASHLYKIAQGKPEKSLPRSRFEDFAEDLRVYRNKVPGHVLKERFDGFPLGDFYSKHHAFVVWLVLEAESWWKTEYRELASHPSIQQFSDMFSSK